MLTAASVTSSSRGYVGTSITKTWLMRRRCAARVARDDRGHQLVGVQAALHQRLDLAGARHLDRLLGGGMAVLDGDDAVGRDVDALGRRRGADLRLGPDQHRHDEPAPRRLDRAEQRVAVAGMDDGGGTGGALSAALDQRREAVVAPEDDLAGVAVRSSSMRDAVGAITVRRPSGSRGPSASVTMQSSVDPLRLAGFFVRASPSPSRRRRPRARR